MNGKLYIIITIAVIILIVAIAFLIKGSSNQSEATTSSQVTQQEQQSQQPVEQELQQTIEPETIQPIEQAIQSDGLQQDTTVHKPNLTEEQMTPLDKELIEAGATIPPMGNIDIDIPAPQSIYSSNN